MPADDALSCALERLYGVELDAFLALRKQLAGELRKAGDAVGAKALAAAPKPPRTAWALDQVARRQPELIQALLRARGEASTPAAGDAEGFRQAVRDYRERVSDVVRAARERLQESGMDLNAEQTRRLTETLHAACAAEGPARALLVAGMLTRDVKADDPLALLAVGSGPGASPQPALAEKRDTERRARAQRDEAIASARARVAELEVEARDARAKSMAAETEAARTVREARAAKEAMDHADARLAAARKELEQLD
jgi:hypothetical protein